MQAPIHTTQCRAGRFYRHLALLIGVASFFAIAPSHAWAQPGGKADAVPELKFRYAPGQEFAKTNVIQLRPNTKQNVYLYVRNTGKDPLNDLTAKLMVVGDDNSATQVGEAKVGTVPANKEAQLVFGKPQPPAPKNGKEEKAAPAAPATAIPGPPFELQVWFEAKGEILRKQILSVFLMQPVEYVDSQVSYNADDRTVTVKLKSKPQNPIEGPLCTIDLVLRPELIPGLIPTDKKGAYRQFLPQPGNEPVELVARNLKFEGAPPDSGRIYLTVDGYERAFAYLNSFTQGNPVDIGGSRIRIFAPRYAEPSSKIPVTLQVDPSASLLTFNQRDSVDQPRPLPQLRVALGVDLAGDGKFFTVREFPGTRQQKVTVDPAGPGGALVFDSIVNDWQVELDLSKLYGPRKLSAQLQLYDSDAKQYKPVVLETEQTDPKLKLPIFDPNVASPYAPLEYGENNQSVLATVTLDDTPPIIHAFADELAKKDSLVKGSALTFQATASDPESNIKEAIFFVGKPGPKGEIPKDALQQAGTMIKGDANNPAAEQIWQAELPLDTSKPGLYDISVLFTNQAGQANTKTITLKLVDPGPGAKSTKGANILGKVTDLAGRPQANVPVTLTDAKGEVKGFTKSKDQPRGAFVFEDLAPGTYVLFATQTATNTSARTIVQVPADTKEVTGVTLKLSR